MNYKGIIKDAWHLTQENKPLMWWYAFIPELVSIVVGIAYLIYQVVAYWKTPIFHEYEGPDLFEESVVFSYNLFTTNAGLAVLLAFVGAIVGLLYFTLPVFSKGALVQLIARMRNGQQVKMVDGLSHGAIHFVPLFEYHLLMQTFSVIGVFTQASFIFRNLGSGILLVVAAPLVLLFLFGIATLLLFAYTQYYIVIDEKRVLKSIGASIRLVIRNWQHTLLIMMMMLLITIRIIFNIIMVFLIPSIIILATAALATVALFKVGIVVGIIVGLIGLYFAAYLAAILEVFSTAVWVFTFLELTSRDEVSARELGEKAPEWATGDA